MNVDVQQNHNKVNLQTINDTHYYNDVRVLDDAVNNQDIHPNQNFYQFYLSEHQNINCRRLHFLGSSLGFLGMVNSIKTRSLKPALKGITAGYACAWIGHFFFEHNKPATFKYPIQSFVSDFKMYADIWRGKVSVIHDD